ncbi:leucine dehydrogenase [Streptomyces griseocarneus]|nr:leucine dehydrogenase [Streptomyces griseocarneus]
MTRFFVAAPDSGRRPANGGLRLAPGLEDRAARALAERLAHEMAVKHDLYATGFCGAKIVVVGFPSRSRLWPAVADALNRFGGSVLTGCDMGVECEDMRSLSGLTPHVLCGFRNPSVDVNTATAAGVVGAVDSVADALGKERSGLSVLVHGVGKVGARVAAILRDRGAEVFTHDIRPEAVVDGCVPVGDWLGRPVDVLVPCSGSGLIDERTAERLPCRAIAGAANALLTRPQITSRILRRRGITHLPGPIVSSGAVICDSIEYYAPAAFHGARPEELYAFVGQRTSRMAARFLRRVRDDRHGSAARIVKEMAQEGRNAPPCSALFAPVGSAA